ncbi:site-specific integrase [Leisingera sp. F5]|uniref:tyrosine-type recombinase/integrase n=1 Tax=Leisingera sp. F5 TaxID=1813816 RepID=UPI000B1C7DD2|nr:site-specific integrase [Leisingera sp. F5]
MSLKLIRRKNKEGKPSGNYFARGAVAGHNVYQSTGTSKRSEAEAWANRLETKLRERHAFGAKATLTFAEAAHEYMLAGGEGRFLAPILEHFGADTLVETIGNDTLLEAAAKVYPDAAPATINRQLIGPVSAVIAMAAENGRANARKFRRLSVKNARTRWLTPAEFERLLTNAADHLAPILACLIGTGCRASEALGAEVDNWHPATGELWLPETKNGHARMVQMPERARDLILAAGVPEDGQLFQTPKGQGYIMRHNGGGQIQTAFNTARDNAGLGPEVTPHVIRHTWATWYYAATKDYGRMLDLGGWRTASTAERYRKNSPADLPAKLLKAGWNFHRLGADLPDQVERRAGLRAV